MNTKNHIRGNGIRCHCGEFHYTCEECGADCTMGAKKGPATTATDGKTRCVTCHDSYGQRLAKLNNAAADLLNAATAARIYVGAAIEYSRTAKELFGMLDAAIKKADQ